MRISDVLTNFLKWGGFITFESLGVGSTRQSCYQTPSQVAM